MANLRFYFGTMGSGKSTMALQIQHNLASRNLRGLLLTRLSRENGRVTSRLGVAADAVEVDPELNLFDVAKAVVVRRGKLDYLVADEAQFYTVEQVEQMAMVVDELNAEVYAFGLITDFRGILFPGTKRLLEIADERSELQVEARCWCGGRALFNARLVNGELTYDGDLVVVGDTDDSEAEVSYELLCRRHFNEGRRPVLQHRLIDLPAIKSIDKMIRLDTN